MDNEWRVTGEVLFGGKEAFAAATVYVRLEDVSFADRPSAVIAEQVIPGVSRGPVAIDLRSAPLDPRGSYSVRVHVDVDGDGQITPGDYVSTESYPVLTHGHPANITVNVRRV